MWMNIDCDNGYEDEKVTMKNERSYQNIYYEYKNDCDHEIMKGKYEYEYEYEYENEYENAYEDKFE